MRRAWRRVKRVLRIAAMAAAALAVAAGIGFGAVHVFADKLDAREVESRLDGQWDCRHAWWRVGWVGWDYRCELASDSAFTCMSVEVDADEITARSRPYRCNIPAIGTREVLVELAKGIGLLVAGLFVLGGLAAFAGVGWSALRRGER